MKCIHNKYSKIIILCVTFFMVLYGLFFLFAPGNTINIPCSKILYYDADKLTKYADLIVIGYSEKDFNEYTPTITYNNAGRYESFYTVTDFKVLKVIKGDDNLNSILVMQCAAFINNSILSKSQKDLMILEDYSVMKKNAKYLLFLKSSDNGSYSIISVNQGKFNIDNLDSDEKNIADNNTQYRDLAQCVTIHFKDKIEEYQN